MRKIPEPRQKRLGLSKLHAYNAEMILWFPKRLFWISSLPIQLHILFEHFGPAVKIAGVGLGWFSESATESAHRDFAAQWSNYIVLDINSPKYINHWFQAVCAYNTRHLWSCEITCNQLNLSKKILIKHDKVQSS